MLNDVVADAVKLANSKQPAHKFACNSTIVQHLVPTSQLGKARSVGTSTGAGDEDGGAQQPSTTTTATASDDADKERDPSAATATDGKPHVGRRGLHSATGAFWDSAKDGMWTFKYDGEAKGLDIIIMLIWIAYQ
jgi:hypothetical protein